MSFLLAMSSLFPEFKVHTETLCGHLHLKQFQRDRYQFTSISCFCSDFNLGTRHTTCVVLLSLLCVIPVSLSFFQCCCFLSFWVSSRIEQSPQTNPGLFPESPERRVIPCELSCCTPKWFFFLRIQSWVRRFFFWVSELVACPLLRCSFSPPSPTPLQSPSRHSQVNTERSSADLIHDIFDQRSEKEGGSWANWFEAELDMILSPMLSVQFSIVFLFS